MIFRNIKMSAKLNNIELNGEFMVMPKEEQPPGEFFRRDILRNFAKFTGKHLCQSRFFNEVCRGGSRAATTSKMECFVIIVND